MKIVQTLVSLAFLAIAACAPVEKTPIVGLQTQGIQDLSLREDQLPTLVYVRTDVPSLGAYDRFIIDSVTVNYDDPDIKELSQSEITRMTTYFRSAVVEELRNGGYKVGTRSEPGTMRISLMVSGFSAPKKGGLANAAGIIASAAVGVPGVVAVSVGEVTIEGAFRQAMTNRLDAVVLSRSQGSRVLNSSPWSTWADVEASFDQWAEEFREAVDEAHRKR